jgi:Icc-related predicted phosphoesterase
MQRRKFLLISGSLGGFSLAACAHQILQPVTSKNPPESAVKQAQKAKKVKIIVISDLNSQYGSTTYDPEIDRAIPLIINHKPDLVLCGGDMVAGQKSSLTEAAINAMWSAFDHHIAAPLRAAKIPFGFTIGNHDASGALSAGKFIYAKERKLAQDYWQNPQHNTSLNFIDKTGFPFYYTFTQNGIFYLVWDASTHLISRKQLNWAAKNLSSSDAKNARMRLVIGHLPLYGIAVGRNRPGDYLADAEQLRAFLEAHQVHTYISGHAHAYYPGKRGQLQLLHAGALGSGPRRLLNSEQAPRKTLTIVDINPNQQETVYTTYDMKTQEAINITSLPPLIMAPNGQVLRRDIPSVN